MVGACKLKCGVWNALAQKHMSQDTTTRYQQLTTTLNRTTPYLRLTSFKIIFPLVYNYITVKHLLRYAM